MSGENVAFLLGQQVSSEDAKGFSQARNSGYTGKYEKRLKEPTKPTYSTFWEQGKEYDGSNAHFFKQRNAIIGKNVAESIYPENFLRRGEGIRHIVPPIHEEKIYRNPPLELDRSKAFGGKNGGAVSGDGNKNGANDANAGGCCACCGCGKASCAICNGNREQPYKDFVASNIVEVSNMVPRRKKLQPEFPTDTKTLGKVPAYLSRVKEELKREKEYVSALENHKDSREQQLYKKYVYRLSDEERMDLLTKLRKKLEEKCKALDKIPISQDSLSISKKKSDLQDEIKDLENGISKISRETIFVYKDDPVNGEWAKNAALKEARCFAASKQKEV